MPQPRQLQNRHFSKLATQGFLHFIYFWWHRITWPNIPVSQNPFHFHQRPLSYSISKRSKAHWETAPNWQSPRRRESFGRKIFEKSIGNAVDPRYCMCPRIGMIFSLMDEEYYIVICNSKPTNALRITASPTMESWLFPPGFYLNGVFLSILVIA